MSLPCVSSLHLLEAAQAWGGLVGDVGGMESLWHRCVRFEIFCKIDGDATVIY